MRKVRLERYVAGQPGKRETSGYYWFHQWVVVDEGDGNGNYRRVVAGILEGDDGAIEFGDPHLMVFQPRANSRMGS